MLSYTSDRAIGCLTKSGVGVGRGTRVEDMEEHGRKEQGKSSSTRPITRNITSPVSRRRRGKYISNKKPVQTVSLPGSHGAEDSGLKFTLLGNEVVCVPLSLPSSLAADIRSKKSPIMNLQGDHGATATTAIMRRDFSAAAASCFFRRPLRAIEITSTEGRTTDGSNGV